MNTVELTDHQQANKLSSIRKIYYVFFGPKESSCNIQVVVSTILLQRGQVSSVHYYMYLKILLSPDITAALVPCLSPVPCLWCPVGYGWKKIRVDPWGIRLCITDSLHGYHSHLLVAFGNIWPRQQLNIGYNQMKPQLIL